MSTEKFFQSRTALITLFAACFVVLISLGVRQTFGLFFMDFNESLKISNTAFGFAIGMQMLMWGLTGPIFGAIADKYGGHIAIISAFIFYTAGIFFLYTGPNLNPETLFVASTNLKTRLLIAKLPPITSCLLYTSPSPRDGTSSRMPSSA